MHLGSGRWQTLLGAALASLLPVTSNAALTTVRVASGLDRPLFATAPPGDSDRLFVVEQYTGRIRVLNLGDGSINATDFLDIDGLAGGGEQGLLGLAFHPDYTDNGFFFVNLTVASGETEIRRYHVSADPNVADPSSAALVIGYAQPQINHNAGWLGFGPDGYLYVATGDGGGAYDDDDGHSADTGNGQDTTDNLLGKLLRIDVNGDDFPADATRNYAIPPTNPFVGQTGDDEIWSYGLRNPWRASFDRATGDLYIGDVGQAMREEIDVQPPASTGGENYGWRLREGTIQTPTVGGAAPPGAIDPIYDYAHGSAAFEGFAVIGGYVYRGPIAEIQGHYFFADYASERIWSLLYDDSDPTGFNGTNFTSLTDRTDELAPGGALAINQISSFAEDGAGNLYILDLGGEIFRIAEASTTTSTTTVTSTTTSSTTTLPLTTTTLLVTTTMVTTTVPATTTTTTTLAQPATCGDPVANVTPAADQPALVTATDALYVLRAAVGTGTCALCVCDVDDSGDITATDALAVLRAAVGTPVTLTCPPC